MKLSKKAGWVTKGLGVGLLVLFTLGMDQPGKDTISKETFKGTWPFTVTEGRIICGPFMAVGFKSRGVTYAVNGLAHKRYSDITPIWLPDPRIKTHPDLGHLFEGMKVSIGDVLSYGLKYCGF